MKYLNKLYLLLCLILASACTDTLEGDDDRANGATQMVNLSLGFAPMTTTTIGNNNATSAIETRAGDDTQINNLCILQFEGEALAETAVLKYIIYNSNPVISNQQMQLSLAPSAKSFLFVCANLGNLNHTFSPGSTTYKDVLTATLSMADQNVFANGVPICGTSGDFNTMTTTDAGSVTLNHILGKVSFSYDISSMPTGSTFEITGVTLRNVPKAASYLPDGTTKTTTTEVMSLPGTETSSGSQQYEWYTAENLRGNATGSNTVSTWTERCESKAPLYSTYVELKGNYTPYAGGNIYEVTYVLYLGDGTNVNNYDLVHNHHYQVKAVFKSIDLRDKRVSTDINLSADGLANCYLASKAGQWYRFNGTVRGNGNSEDYAASQYPGLSLMPSKVGAATDAVTIPKEEIADAVVVWETTQGMINQVRWDAAAGCVKFKTGTAAGMEEGNALIAVRNSAKEILWSWHIWRTSFDLAELNRNHTLKVKTNTKRAFYETTQNVVGMQREVIMMDRNIGAATNANVIEGNKGANCLHYQFGRKDPFPAGTVYNTGGGRVDGDIPLYGYSSEDPSKVSEYKVVDKTIDLSSLSITNDANSVFDYTIKHPEKFIHRADKPYSWIFTDPATEENSVKISQCLWGDKNQSVNTAQTQTSYAIDTNPWDGKKTIYDPSPASWRVAPSDLFSGINGDFIRWTSISIGNVNIEGIWNTGYSVLSTFCPASGSRYGSNGILHNAGMYGFIWYCSSAGESLEQASSMSFIKTSVSIGSVNAHASGISIRCVKE